VNIEKRDVVIIGGGPAGLAAAAALHRLGVRDILIVEREKQLGGILRQCIHDGFGLKRFGEALSGPEYAQRFIDEVIENQIPYLTDATVIQITPQKLVTIACAGGLRQVQAKAVVLAMGCRERPRGALAIPGERPAGVFTAGTAQAYVNLYNRMVGREIVILGSGDIGMIMARRLTLEGAHVQAVFEIQPVPSGLRRNLEQCLNDYHIPLYLSHTITEIHGSSRVTGVTVSRVDERLSPIPGTEQYYACDTVILSAGLIPENELSQEAGVELDGKTRGPVVDEWYQTNVEGIFAAGNVLHVHDLADFVSLEAERLAGSVRAYLQNGTLAKCAIPVRAGDGIHHVVPQTLNGRQDAVLSMRPSRAAENCAVAIRQGGRLLLRQPFRRVLPAEMLQISLKCGQIQPDEEIEVSLE